MRGTNSVISEDDSGESELRVFRKKWQEVLQKGDPYYNLGRIIAEKNLSREKWLYWYSGV